MCFLKWGGLSQRWGFCTVSSRAPAFVKTKNSATGSEWEMNSVGNDVVAKQAKSWDLNSCFRIN